jgi:nucleotide-binding universal stress UspA family protein
MKKILLAFDGTSFSEGAFEFARQINSLNPVLLTGVFIPQLSYANLWSYANGMAGPTYVPLLETDDSDAIEKSIRLFEQLCTEYSIKYTIHKDFFDFALPELKKETRFADLLVISSEIFYKDLGRQNPSEYLKDALHSSECPVIVVPEKFKFPKVNILAYDGSESSVFAIKQFAYIFPELTSQETLLFYISPSEDEKLPDNEKAEELVRQHFSNVSFLKLSLNPKKHFTDWINNNPDAILVSGSFGRSSLSEMFRKSFVANIIAEHKLPVFIAHK